jgi:sugar transferase EpsL
MRRATVKRMIDLVGASVGLVVLAVPMAIVATLVRLTLGSPVIFRQTRPGFHGRLFQIYKFRTMRDATDAAGNPLPDRLRATPFGRFLRQTSLDELPELVNVIRGEMSLVGPRPLRVDYLELYSREQARRHDVMPGITGLAQVSGRNTLSWDDRLALDTWYVDHASLWLDAKILARTIFKVVRRSDVSADGDLDVPVFQGTADQTDRKRGSPLTGVET